MPTCRVVQQEKLGVCLFAASYNQNTEQHQAPTGCLTAVSKATCTVVYTYKLSQLPNSLHSYTDITWVGAGATELKFSLLEQKF